MAVFLAELRFGDQRHGQGFAIFVVSIGPFDASRRTQGGEQESQGFVSARQSPLSAASGRRLHLEGRGYNWARAFQGKRGGLA